jgi:hypothetical protein
MRDLINIVEGHVQSQKPVSVDITTALVPIPVLVRKALKSSGGARDYWASSGRCYEFRDYLYSLLKKNGYNPHKTESMWWANGDFRKFKKPMGYAEENMLCDSANNHAWIFCDGKCYDSLNPDGADRPVNMRYFRGMLGRYRPDEDDEIHCYKMGKFGTIYDPASDTFVKATKTQKQHFQKMLDSYR